MKCKSINKENLKHNLKIIRSHLNNAETNLKTLKGQELALMFGKYPLICAVVKANAYGHGVVDVCPLIAKFIQYFAVANLKEAIEIILLKLKKPILIIGKIDDSEIEMAIKYKINISISDLNQLKLIEKIASKLKIPAFIHIKINCGMNRLGVKLIEEYSQMLIKCCSSNFIFLKGVYTHFSCSNFENIDILNVQNEKFLKFVQLLQSTVIIHASNSMAFMTNPKLTYDMIRAGISIYGYADNIQNLKPVMQVDAPIIFIQNIKKGEYVGYGTSFKAKKSMQIAVLGLGYADGINRKLSQNGYVVINGNKSNIIGNICMDMFMVDITDLNIKSNYATILGKNGDEVITANELAKLCDTIPYEILTNFNNCRK